MYKNLIYIMGHTIDEYYIIYVQNSYLAKYLEMPFLIINICVYI